MKCPSCGCNNDAVIDSRPCPEGIRRRRKCEICNRRWTTIEANAAEIRQISDRARRGLQKLESVLREIRDGLTVETKLDVRPANAWAVGAATMEGPLPNGH